MSFLKTITLHIVQCTLHISNRNSEEILFGHKYCRYFVQQIHQIHKYVKTLPSKIQPCERGSWLICFTCLFYAQSNKSLSITNKAHGSNPIIHNQCHCCNHCHCHSHLHIQLRKYIKQLRIKISFTRQHSD